jgi:LysM repeat protein
MTDSVLPRPAKTPVTAAPAATAAICPYLMSSDGRWRASTPTRAHRCTVVTPPAILAAEKQRRLCLTAEHVDCSTYLAANDPTAVAVASGPIRADRRRLRAVPRTAPLVLDHGRLSINMPALRGERGAGQTGLVALMAVAFAAIVIARLSSGGPMLTPAQVGAGLSASPSAGASRAPVTSPAASNAPTRTLVPTEVEATPAPAGASPAQAARTYKVRSGDTLGGIAREFGTTVAILAKLNGIENPRLLRVGQVLKLP